MLNGLDEWFNAFESFFWFGVGLISLRSGFHSKSHALVWLGFLFVLFGVSDVIEIYTGAWWNPFWLLIAKAVILTGIIVSFLRWRRNR